MSSTPDQSKHYYLSELYAWLIETPANVLPYYGWYDLVHNLNQTWGIPKERLENIPPDLADYESNSKFPDLGAAVYLVIDQERFFAWVCEACGATEEDMELVWLEITMDMAGDGDV